MFHSRFGAFLVSLYLLAAGGVVVYLSLCTSSCRFPGILVALAWPWVEFLSDASTLVRKAALGRELLSGGFLRWFNWTWLFASFVLNGAIIYFVGRLIEAAWKKTINRLARHIISRLTRR